MRGKDRNENTAWKILGITPAYAGKSRSKEKAETAKGDHPRVCGEKVLWLFVIELIKGSPPRMRGKEYYVFSPKIQRRITPAYAGKRTGASAT